MHGGCLGVAFYLRNNRGRARAVFAFGAISLISLTYSQSIQGELFAPYSHVAMILVMMNSHGLLGMSFRSASLLTALGLLGYTAAITVISPLSGVIQFDHLMWLVSAQVTGMLMSYTLEEVHRDDFRHSQELQVEREKSDRLLLNILPAPIADRLKAKSGSIALVGRRGGKLTGILTDGDFRRSALSGPNFLQRPVREFMTRNPKVISADALGVDAVRLFEAHRIDDLIAVDHAGRPVGLVDSQDLPKLRIV